ncbi:retrovirus-related Pol polyprotein from transposon 17.6 [Trichonephila clavipes]|nr:retrovirus-related Pol polyprotein from transposon 17.6 [Trichonephila clavipes]
MKKAIEIVQAAEASREQIRNMKYDTATINFMKENHNKPKTQYNCKKCGRKHKPRECPAFGKICAKCKKKNHFAAKCFQSTKNIHEMNVPENELVYIDSMNKKETKCAMKFSTDSNFKNVEMVSEKTWYKNVSLDVNNKCFDVHFKLDTGAEVNILPLYILSMFKVNPKLSKTNTSLTTYGNFNLKPNLSLIINCSTDKFKNVPLPFYVVKSKPILGLRGSFGRYKFNKILFGIVSAPEVFQKRNQKLFGDIEGVEIYFDDIFVAGCDKDSHDAIMCRVLERTKLLNIKFNPDKLQYRVSEVKYVGQIISKSGIKPDPDHIKQLFRYQHQNQKLKLGDCWAWMNFLSKFLPNVSKVTAPLRKIIHESVEFNWGKEQELSFVNIKELLAKVPILKVFSVNNEIVIQCDSSKHGLGSCLIQKGQSVSFVSCSLTNSEKNYAQIEKELLAIVFFFSFEKYHNFVYGRKVVVQSDHKPLMANVKKPMHKISSRVQRMILKLLKYDFEINYVPGNQMFLADTLSRAFPVSETKG